MQFPYAMLVLLKSMALENYRPNWNSMRGKILAVRKRSTISGVKMENSKVLLLGASGRLGLMMQAFWPEKGTLVCHSRSSRPGYVTFNPLSDADLLASAMSGARAVICLSGITPAHAAASGDALTLNAELALATVRAAGRAGGVRVFLASSAAVYGAAEGPLSEDMMCNPVSEYGRAKLEMEKVALASAKARNLPVTVLRIGNVAGADAILGGWHNRMAIDVLPDGGTPRRSYIGPQTLTHVLYQLCQAQSLPDVLNVAAPGMVEMGALLDAAGLAWSQKPATGATIAQVELSTKRIEKEFDFAPNAGTPTGLVAQWRAYQDLK